MFQQGLVFPHPYPISFLSYCSSKNHIQIAEEIMLIIICWTLIHIKCEVRCRKIVKSLLSFSGSKENTSGNMLITVKERRES